MDGERITKVIVKTAATRAIGIEYEDEHGERHPFPFGVAAVTAKYGHGERPRTMIELNVPFTTEAEEA